MKNEAEKPMKIGDEDLAKLFHDVYEKLAPAYGYETRKETRTFDPESKNGKLMIAVAHEVRTRVIEKLANQSAAYLLQSHRNALYDSMPVGEVDAFDLLNIVNGHLNKVDQALATLKEK